jgi:hypothetical protein
MATQREKSVLATIFADNTLGNIKPEDLRDFVETMHFSAGIYYISTPATTTISVGGTFYKAAGTTTAGYLHRFTMPTDNRLTYTGDATIRALVLASSTLIHTGSGTKIGGIKIAKNGVVNDESERRTLFSTSPYNYNLSTLSIIELSTNDYIELWVTNFSSTDGVQTQYMTLAALGFMV